MSINRYAKKRDANEKEIVEALLKAGYSVVRLDTPLDLLVGKNGVTWLLEVKMPDGELTKPQKEFIKTWQGQFAIARTPEEALAAVEG